MKTESLDLMPTDKGAADSLAVRHHAQDPAAVAIVKLMESPDALKNVEALERMGDLYLKLQAADAEKQFALAFNALQAEMAPVQATKTVPNNDGTTRYIFAPYESIMAQVRPLLLKHGFTVSFSSDVVEGRVTQHCTLQHVAGHKRTNSFAARVSKPPGASEAQGDGATSTYAKRFALCDCLNIVIEKDTDARSEGDVISQDKALYLIEQVKETRADERTFLALAGVPPGADANAADVRKLYFAIHEDKYDMLVRELAKKAAKMRAGA